MTTTRGRWKSQTQVNTTDGGADEFDGQVAALQDGGYIVVWTLAASPRLLTNAFGPTILGVALEAHPPSHRSRYKWERVGEAAPILVSGPDIRACCAHEY
jgi:hypothetical protein